MFLPINLDRKVSKYFTVRDLSVTKTGITNFPGSEEIKNLEKLGPALDILRDKIGPFTIHSAFRTPEVQAKVGSTAKKSFHELGLAVDLTPTTMNLEKYFTKILANPNISNLFGEKSIKPSQNSIHLSIKVPGGPDKIMERLVSGKYVALSDIKIAGLISKYGKTFAVSIGAAFMFLGGLFLYLQRKK